MKRDDAERLLKQALDNSFASFREGQWEALNAIVNERKKLLVVQRTGWGKSAVYFLAAKVLKQRGFGITIVISPLLSLMRNQVELARKFGVLADTINSTNENEWQKIMQQVNQGKINCLFISPERLANEEFLNNLLIPIAERVGLLVIDEIHCISDWGHDFRPDYRRIMNILRYLPSNMPVLGTTATANDRVIQDIHSLLGGIEIQRGDLVRKNLSLYTVNMPKKEERLVWLARVVPQLEYSGIIYTLTIRDAEMVATWLQSQGILAKAYHSAVSDKNNELDRECLEQMLLDNQLKVLVATNALGMGFDKPDLGFVIHFQAPNSIISYYQQIGRAGRGIDKGVIVLMQGEEDDYIHRYFRNTAYPSEDNIVRVLKCLDEHSGLTETQLQEKINLKKSDIQKVLKILQVENPSPVTKINKIWYRTPISYQVDRAKILALMQTRDLEWKEMLKYVSTTDCKMQFLCRALDSPIEHQPCGKCSSCKDYQLVRFGATDTELLKKAQFFLKHQSVSYIEPRKRGSEYFLYYSALQNFNIPKALMADRGLVLSYWGNSGIGKLVQEGKQEGYFSDELVCSVSDVLRSRWGDFEVSPRWICAIPSTKHQALVADFAQRLSDRLGIPFFNAIIKVRENSPQKEQNNAVHQCRNLDGVFAINQKICFPKESVIVIDDTVDSGWTFTVAAMLLRQAGIPNVYPVALASTQIIER